MGGGAWKVAYADFVTAMMAFFLLLWILSMVPPDTKAVAPWLRGLRPARDETFSVTDAADDVLGATVAPAVGTSCRPCSQDSGAP